MQLSEKYFQSIRKSRKLIYASFIVASLTFIIYLPALESQFVNWDDALYVYENYNIRTIDFKWILTAIVGSLWHPLTLLSLAIDYAMWGLNPLGYHLTNNIFHAINTSLVFILSIKLINQANPVNDRLSNSYIIGAIVTALLFGMHPLHVESVAWVSERKDVLCAFFFLSTLLSYITYTTASSKRPYYYCLCLILFALALLSKPMAVSLPLVLLILDFYPLERWNGLKNIKSILIEKTPFFLLSLAVSIITIVAQSSGEALQSVDVYPWKLRILDALHAFGFYLIKMFFPFNLAPFYPHTVKLSFFTLGYLISFASLLAITFLTIRSLKKDKLFFSVWLYYLVTLIPVIGIVKVGSQSMADRYAYLPSIGPFILAGIGVGVCFNIFTKKIHLITITAALVLILGAMVNKTIRQIAVWHDSVSLWSLEIKLFPEIDFAYTQRGSGYSKSGNFREGIKDYERAVGINPQNAEAYYNLGNTYSNLKDYQQAILNYNFAVKLKPKYSEAYNNRGMAYNNLGNHKLAIEDFNMAIKHDPKNAKAFNNRGISYSLLGDTREAINSFNRAVELNPQNATSFYNRGVTYYSSGDLPQAIVDFNKAIELNAKYAAAYYFLGLTYSKTGVAELARRNYTKAASLGIKEAQGYLSRQDIN